MMSVNEIIDLVRSKFTIIINNYIPLDVLELILGIIVFVIIVEIIKKRNKKKKNQEMKKYIDEFKKYFYNTSYNIKETLMKVNENFNEKSKIHIIICKALFYLDNSIDRDYVTALKIIEEYFNHIDVSDLHKGSIAIVKTAVYKDLQKKIKEEPKRIEAN